jgi:hypothetical protein
MLAFDQQLIYSEVEKPEHDRPYAEGDRVRVSGDPDHGEVYDRINTVDEEKHHKRI